MPGRFESTGAGRRVCGRALWPCVAVLVLGALSFAGEALADSAPDPSAGIVAGQRAPAEARPAELIYEGMASYGNFRVFGSAESARMYLSGAEVDRELWPRVLGARIDYVSEVLPVVLLWQPAKADFWGDPLTRNHQTVYGAGVTPIGFRMLWRNERRWMPYFETKASVYGFTKKALSPVATYENWSFHCTGGLKIRLRGRYDLRLGLLSDLHISNAFVVRSNPALDVMNADVGLVYHLGGRGRR